MTIKTNPHIPTWICLPVNNNRTCFRPFGLPMILMETDRRDLAGNSIENSGPIVQNCDCGFDKCDCMGVHTTECNEYCNGAAVRLVIEKVPQNAIVVGQIPIGLMSPDHEIFAKNVSMSELVSRMIHPEMQTFWRAVGISNTGVRSWIQIDYADAIAGDLMEYTTATGVSTEKEFYRINPVTEQAYPTSVIEYYPTANYYDISDITIETEELPSDWYYLTYQAEYYVRIESTSTPGQLNCIDITRKATSVYRFRLNHPGHVIEETVRLTPAPYLTSNKKSEDTTIEFYRPFTDALQDIFDEQYLLGSINWVDYITPEFVPYLCYLLGLDIPYFPQSLNSLRKTMLRNVVRLQQLKGSKNAIYDLFELFGYIVYTNSLYWSKDGKRLIRPGERLPSNMSDQEIQVEERCQLEPILVAYNTSGFGELTIPLLYRPIAAKINDQGIIDIAKNGKIVLNAYLIKKNVLGIGTVSVSQTINLIGTNTTFLTDFIVGDSVYVAGETEKIVAEVIDDTHLITTSAFINITNNTTYTHVSEAYKQLDQLSCDIGTSACNNDPSNYASCGLPVITNGVDSWSQITIDESANIGNQNEDILSGDQPPFTSNGVKIDRKANLLKLTFNGSIQFDDKYGLHGANGLDNELLLYAFATYNREYLVIPDTIKNLRSNRFDIQLLTQDGDQISGDVLEFLIDYLFKIKAFHSLLNTLIYHADLNETYQVTPFCIGGDIEQRYNIDAGKLQVPPAILPHDPIDSCLSDPEDLGYKATDLALRKKILENLPDEFQNWINVNQYLKQAATIDSPYSVYIDRDVKQIGDEKLPQTPESTNSGDCKFVYRGQDRLVPGDLSEHETTVYTPTPIDNSTSITSQSTLVESPISNIAHGEFYPTGASASSNGDSAKYGIFVKEYSTSPKTFCELDGISDYCYKGRVDDELLHRMTMLNEEQYQAVACTIGLGHGIYYYFVATSELTNSIQGKALKQSYDTNMPNSQNNFLGRLLRAYDTVEHENIHYTDRPYLINGVSTENSLLALQRPSLNIQVPLMHFPGTRFATINKLENDFVSPIWMAKPWDDPYSSYCGPYSCSKPTFLNAKLVENTAGDEVLVFDNVQFTIESNGLKADIPTFGSHIIGTDSRFTDNDVVHSVYSNQPNGNSAITLESVSPASRSIYSTTIDYVAGGITWTYNYNFDEIPTIIIGLKLKTLSDSIYPLCSKIINVTLTSATIKVYKVILDGADLVFMECATDDVTVHLQACGVDGIINATDSPLFQTAALCSGTNINYIDYIDGYPASFGYQPYIPYDFDRSGTYTELFNELGIDRSMPTGTEVLFYFISGILYQKGYRFGCNCAILICESGSPTIETNILDCSLNHYWIDDGYDYNPDQLIADITLDAEESVGAHDLAFDGQISNTLELCSGFPVCQNLRNPECLV